MAFTPFAEVRSRLTAYCRIDEPMPPTDELLLQDIYHAAVGELASHNVEEPPTGEEHIPRRALYNICVDSLVLSMWDSRAAVVEKAMVENPAFTSKLNRLKMHSVCKALAQHLA